MSAVAPSLTEALPRLPPRKARQLSGARLLDVLMILGVAALAGVLVIRAEVVLNYHWHWSIIGTYLVRIDPATGTWEPNLLLRGFFTTIRLAIWSLLLGTLMGAVGAGLLVYGRPAFRWLARCFVEIVRDMPPIVLIFALYFFVSSQVVPALGLQSALLAAPGWLRAIVTMVLAPPDRINDFLSGLACLALLAGAYITEILRSGLQSIPRGQSEAGYALGLRGWAVFRLVILPQAVRDVLPALAGQLIVSIKDSSLVALISIPELTFMTSEVSSSTQRFFEVWLFTAGLYFCLCFSLSMLFSTLERRWRRA